MISLGSMGFERADVPGTGPYCFKIHGEVYHRVGPLHPACDADTDDGLRRYAQLYMVDAEIANQHRLGLNVNDGVDPSIVVYLGMRNEHTHLINGEILSRLPGEMSIRYSVDSALGADDSPAEYPDEFLHGLYPSGMPPHELKLKVGCVVMLLRNNNASRGLCNGTRLIVQRIGEKVLECSLLNGLRKGQRVFIPKVRLEPSDLELGFRFFRYQFPVRLSYSMTIYKAQGQSMERVVVYLANDVYTRG